MVRALYKTSILLLTFILDVNLTSYWNICLSHHADEEPPYFIFCRGDIQLSTDPNQPTKFIRLPSPFADDNSGIVLVECFITTHNQTTTLAPNPKLVKFL